MLVHMYAMLKIIKINPLSQNNNICLIEEWWRSNMTDPAKYWLLRWYRADRKKKKKKKLNNTTARLVKSDLNFHLFFQTLLSLLQKTTTTTNNKNKLLFSLKDTTQSPSLHPSASSAKRIISYEINLQNINIST
jgi:hypothetical protein